MIWTCVVSVEQEQLLCWYHLSDILVVKVQLFVLYFKYFTVSPKLIFSIIMRRRACPLHCVYCIRNPAGFILTQQCAHVGFLQKVLSGLSPVS